MGIGESLTQKPITYYGWFLVELVEYVGKPDGVNILCIFVPRYLVQ